jgi:hypothetical protein
MGSRAICRIIPGMPGKKGTGLWLNQPYAARVTVFSQDCSGDLFFKSRFFAR